MLLPVSWLVICLNFLIKVTLRVALLQLQVTCSLNGKGTTILEYACRNNDGFVLDLFCSVLCSLNCRGQFINGVSVIE